MSQSTSHYWETSHPREVSQIHHNTFRVKGIYIAYVVLNTHEKWPGHDSGGQILQGVALGLNTLSVQLASLQVITFEEIDINTPYWELSLPDSKVAS